MRLIEGSVSFLLCLALLGGCTALPESCCPDANAITAESKRAQAIFAAHWEETARLYPEFATYRGDHRYGDRFRDRSPEGIAADEAYWRKLQTALKGLDRNALPRDDRLSVEILQRLADVNVEFQRFEGLRSMTVNAAPFSFQGAFVDLLLATPTASEEQVEQMLARMAAYPRRVDQEVAVLRRGKSLGWAPSRAELMVVLAQLDKQLATPVDQSPYFNVFTNLGAAIPAARQETLRTQGRRAVEAHVYPAIRNLRDFVATEYLPASPEAGGLSSYPGGAEAYAMLVRVQTTTDLTPEQVHAIGLDKVASLQREINEVMQSASFSGTFAEFVKFLNSDPRFFHRSGDELLAAYRDIGKRLDAALPSLFAELPRTPYGVRAMPDYMSPGAAEFYNAPTLDGTRPGWFNANAHGYANRPKWGMETTAAHEAVPGHHLQWARAAELKNVPAFRRRASFTAFNEGWALYAETLGKDLGLYRDPYSRFGFLQAQMWRAVRLVVDTGIHAKRWSRQRAMDYMRDMTGLDEAKVSSEIDRYFSDPGQALGYMIGQLKIIELRERAAKALGAKFDLRKFHMVVLDSGQVPLDVLERVVEGWVEEMKGRN